MQSIAVDSGPLLALFDGSDRYHSDAVRFVREVEGRLVTNVPVLTEVSYLLDFSWRAQVDFLQWARRVLVVDEQTAADIPRITAIIEKYRDRPADFADASIVALCERIETDRVASIDSDFDIYRLHRDQPVVNVFPRHG